MYLDQRSDQHWQPTNPGGMSTSQTFPVRGATLTPPNLVPAGQGVVAQGDGVIAIGAPSGAEGAGFVRLKPFGQTAAGQTFQLQVLAWTSTSGIFGAAGQNVAPEKTWLKSVLATYAVTLGTDTGAIGGDLNQTVNFASAVTMISGPTFPVSGMTCPNWFIDAGEVYMPTFGARYLEFLFALGASAVGANCLVLRA
jgi:hypothetical protein